VSLPFDISAISRSYRMAVPESDRAARLLLKALDSLPERDRRFVITKLLSGMIAIAGTSPGIGSMPRPALLSEADIGGLRFEGPWSGGPVRTSRQADQPLLVRLPSGLHVRLRRWATAHGFSMAGVVRGLVERFLDEQGDRPRGRST
jgi:hypothetical protein